MPGRERHVREPVRQIPSTSNAGDDGDPSAMPATRQFRQHRVVRRLAGAGRKEQRVVPVRRNHGPSDVDNAPSVP
jgi:hypothetical protein